MTHVTDAAGLDLGRFPRAGDRIVIGRARGEPTTLVEALIAQGADFRAELDRAAHAIGRRGY